MIVLAAGVGVYFYRQRQSHPPVAGYILKPDEGELLERGKDNTITVKVDPSTGSPSMAAGTQSIGSGGGIPMHAHDEEDEMLFVHTGGGTATVGDRESSIAAGDTIYVPRGVWHSVRTGENGITLLWVVTPPGLENFFREISAPRGMPARVLTPAQIDDVGKKHGTRFKRQ